MKTIATLSAAAALLTTTALAQTAATGDPMIDARVNALVSDGYTVEIRQGLFGTRVEAENEATDMEVTLVYRGGELVREKVESGDDIDEDDIEDMAA